MNPEYKAYRRAYAIAAAIVTLFYRIRVTGRENVPEGAALVCANHSSNYDPFILMKAMTVKVHLHMMAKKELFDFKPLGAILRSIGTFPVDRKIKDISAIKKAMAYLMDNEKVAIFPEGKRVSDELSTQAKSGAVRIADKMRVPVVPVYIPRKKFFWGRMDVVIGKPFYVCAEGEKLKAADFEGKARQLMENINGLRQG